MAIKHISIVTPCYNEEENVQLLSEKVRNVFKNLPDYDYEHIFADNCSKDNTLSILKQMAQNNKRIKIIVNAANFGPVKSVFNGTLAASGDAVVILAADLQDPPEMIAEFIEKWEQGFQIVFGIREKRSEAKLMTFLRKTYYTILEKISENDLVKNAGDFVLLDKDVLKVLKKINDTNPYIRGLLSSMGFRHTGIKYHMQQRHSGKSSTTLFSLFTYALNGIVSHTMLPLRVATFVGISMSFVSIIAALIHLLLKLIYWDSYQTGLITISIGLFFFIGVQLFLTGFMGEYIGAIHRQVKGFSMVVEKERINFDNDK